MLYVGCLIIGVQVALSGGQVASAATIKLPALLEGHGAFDPRGPGLDDDLPLTTDSAARGIGMFELDNTTNVLSYEILFTDALLSGAEIGAELRAPALTSERLFPLPLGRFKAGVVQLTPSDVASLTAWEWALTIRTTAFPEGEIGGRIGVSEPTGSALLLTGGIWLIASACAGRTRRREPKSRAVSRSAAAICLPRTRLAGWLLLGLGFCDANAARGQTFAPITYEARRTASAVTLDGNLDEPAWAAADPIDRFSIYQQGPPAAQPVVTRVLWDDNYVYAGFELSDADLWAIEGHDAYLWESDVAELFFQPTPGAGPYYELEVSPKAEVLDLYWLERLTDFEGAKAYESQLEAVVQARGTVASAAASDPLHDDLDDGWTLELRVPRTSLAPFAAGDEWGFLASAADYPRPPGASTLQFTSLLPAPYGFHTYERWERLAFVDQPLIPGDADRNGRVDLADFGALKAHFGLPGTLREGEFTRDRQIDLADFGVLKANFGRSAAAPEPSALALALAGLAAVCMGSNWRRAGWRGRRAPFQR